MPDQGYATLPAIGETLTHYRIIEKLGAGGMGVVYRALDLRLNRDVAIKFLREDLMADAHGMQRFHREARALAALNHPNIASIYQFEECEPSGALVMELVDGPTLADKVASGSIPLTEALSIALQISEALECAHERGIIHRDLKPGNVKLREDGTVKVLDFGLATFLDPDSGAGPADLSTMATAVSSKPGCPLGTPAYMSPEQARGAKVDRRADIWAFGVVLYEMLSGRHAFHRATSSDSIAAIIKEEPDWTALPADTPAPVLHLLRRCLAKDAHERLHAIADARLEIEEISSAQPTDEMQTGPAKASVFRQKLPWIVSALLIIAAATVALVSWFSAHRTPALKPSERFSILLPHGAPLAPASVMPLAVGRSSLALSPDGSHLVYVALVDGNTRLYVRDMQRGDYRALAGTDGAHSPFFSPDGQWIGFFSHDKLKKVSLSGDPPVTLCDATLGFGGSWAPDGQIYFSTDYSSGINRVSESGGPPTSITGEAWNLVPSMFPEVLPQNRGIIFSIQTFVLGVYDLQSQKGQGIFDGGTFPRYSPTGHILFARRGTVQVAPFDLKQLRLTGSPVQLFDGVRTERDGAAQFTFSENGTFVYANGGDGAVGSMVAVDRQGNKHALQAPPGDYSAFRISPDGTRVAIPVNTSAGTDIWLYDIARGTTTRFTSDARSSFPVWSDDGNAIYYLSWPNRVGNLFRKSTQGGDAVQLTHWQQYGGAPLTVTPDGKNLLVGRYTPETKEDLWLLRLADDGSVVEETPFLASRFSECLADVSPNGRWVAYTSDESGGWEIYVTSFPHPGEKTRISTTGGEEPLWSPNGRELYYRFGTKWFVVDVNTGDRFAAGRPSLLFEGPFANLPGYSYGVMPQGDRFLVVEGVDQTKAATELNVVTNVFDEIKRRASSSSAR